MFFFCYVSLEKSQKLLLINKHMENTSDHVRAWLKGASDSVVLQP